MKLKFSCICFFHSVFFRNSSTYRYESGIQPLIYFPNCWTISLHQTAFLHATCNQDTQQAASYLVKLTLSISQLDFRTPPGFDRTRNAEIGNKDIKFKHLEEAFTSEHWLVRIYKVKNLDNREPLDHKLRSVVPKQKYTSKKVAGHVLFCCFGYVIHLA